MTLEIGETAPSFQALATDGEEVKAFNLDDEIGDGPVVLGFFPFAFTGGCHAQMCDLRDNLPDLQQAGAKAFGISADSPFALKVWHNENGFNFPLVSDHNLEAIEAFGLRDDVILGMEHAQRACFVLDDEGNVAWAWATEDPSVTPEIEEIKGVVAKLDA